MDACIACINACITYCCCCCDCPETAQADRPVPQVIDPSTPSRDSPNHNQLVGSLPPPSTESRNQPRDEICLPAPAACPPRTPKKPTPTLQDVTDSFKSINITIQADVLITAIKEILDANTIQNHTQDNPTTSSSHPSMLNSLIQSGGKFLKFVNDQIEKMKTDPQLEEATKMVGDTLKAIGDVHWTVAYLSIIGYLVSKRVKMTQNSTECLEILREMLRLVSHFKDFNILIKEEEENFDNAFRDIIEGSICCASQLKSGNFFRFCKSSLNAEKLTAIRSQIKRHYRDLNTAAHKKMLREKTITKEILPQDYPSDAVGIDDQLKEVTKLLDTEDCSSFAVVIWGSCGIGKTTLAKAAVSEVDRNRYNYARIFLDSFFDDNKCIKMQKYILKDAFPTYEGGKKIEFRDDEDGRSHLQKACGEANKPVFLFIDNALRKKDLEKILPKKLGCFPQGSRILITTRMQGVTESVLQDRGLQSKYHPVQKLSHDHALTVLCNDPASRDAIKDDLEKILNLCDGIPLVLKIVGAHLRRHKYTADIFTQILGALQTEGEIQEEKQGDLNDFVDRKLDECTPEAFLQICYKFHKYYNLSKSHTLYCQSVLV